MKKKPYRKIVKDTIYKSENNIEKRNENLRFCFALIFSFVCFASFVFAIVYLMFIIKNL
jgi:hypothetical protein